MRLPSLLAALVLALVLSTGGALAQDDANKVDYEAWSAVADRAEQAVEAGRASDDAFESLRAEIVIWRDRFLQAQSANAERIKTLRAQLDALGPAPAEGETEAAEIAARRADLRERLAVAQAPVKAADEAFRRADGLAREIDGIIRERQADALTRLGPTPLNPANWAPAMSSLTGSFRAIVGETREAMSSEIKLDGLRQTLPRTLLFLALAALLVLRGRSALRGIDENFFARLKGPTGRVAEFLLSLGQVAVPVLGIWLFVTAVSATGLLGFRGELVAGLLSYFGFCVFAAIWLGNRLFPRDAEDGLPVHFAQDDGRRIRRATAFLGLLLGGEALVSTIAEYDEFAEADVLVLQLPIAVLAGLALFRIGRVIFTGLRAQAGGEPLGYTARWLGHLGRAVVAVGVVGILLAGIGYMNAALFLLIPTTLTLALVGLLLLLNGLMRDVYAMIVGLDSEAAQAALLPTLLNFAMVLGALPLFALIWGARTADLTELWAQFRKGFAVGETRISPENFLTFALVFMALYLATRILQGALRNSVLPKTRIDPGGQTAMVSGVGYIGIFLAAIIAITAAGIDLSSLALVAGALSVGIGFGLQNIVQNFVSGIILLVERPVAEGDWVQVGSHTGIVRKISVRSTVIETFDKTEVIVPNGDFIAGSVTNWTRSNTIGRIKVPVGVAYGSDTRRVTEILKEIAQEHPLVTVDPEPGVDFLGFGADSMDFQIRAVLSDVNFSLSAKTELNHRIAERFAEEGIQIPFPQRDIWLRNPEAFAQTAPGHRAGPRSAGELHLTDADKELDPDLIADGEGES